jgi:hypothetical protein
MAVDIENVRVQLGAVFGGVSTELAFESRGWESPVTYFVGRNGSGKSRTARAIVGQVSRAHILSTDRLSGLMTFVNYGWTSVPQPESMRGVPLADAERNQARAFSRQHGSAIDDMYALKDQPDVALRVAAFLRRALGRVIELRESAGFLDPHIRVGDIEYSLLRDEGHGLRELVTLLTAVYRDDWALLIVDEPELHLHPSLARLWLSELERVCVKTNRRAIVVTHEPTMIKPATAADLSAVWHFQPNRGARPVLDHVPAGAHERVTAALRHNPQLLAHLLFSPRPVLVEGTHDQIALTTALARICPPEVVAQTDFVECGGSGAVALWFEIAKSMNVDVRAVADLDACLTPEVQRVMDRQPEVVTRYRNQLAMEPAKTAPVMRPLLDAMKSSSVQTDPKSRARWLADKVPPESGWASRSKQLQEIWRDAGLWLHPQGTLEDVLNISAKGPEAAQAAASKPGDIDAVAAWAAYELDTAGDVEELLNQAVERIAHGIMEALRVTPEAVFAVPVGATSSTDQRLVAVTHLGEGTYRLTVKQPSEFEGWWLEFSRDTASSQMVLCPPS